MRPFLIKLAPGIVVASEPVTFSAVQFSAMNLLAMREHSVAELRQKLQKKFKDSELVNQVIDDLATRNLQSDERFAEAFVKMRIRQGKGPVRILYELKEKGIAEDLAAALVDLSDQLWVDLAKEVCLKRFGMLSGTPRQDNAKQIRFLQYRGFTSTHIRKITM